MDDILGSIYSLLIALVGSLYELVSKAFELFYVLSEASTIEKSVYENVVKNFYLIIGIVMLFTIAFSLLKSMVSSDDDKGTANAGKIVTNFVTSIIILLILPTIFSFAFSFQTAVVNQNTIGRIFGMNATENSGNSIASAGNEMANSVFTAFFTPSDTFCKKNNEEGKMCSEILENDDGTTLYQAISSVNKNGWFGIYSDFGNQVADGDISFNFFVLLIAGLFLLYVVASFCLDLGVRLVKLVFYQIIAPIPVFMRVVPDGKLSNTFNEWTKITITCYIEVFLRLFIIYFGVFLVSAFLNDKGLGTLFSNLNGGIGLIAKAILVLSIVVFIKQAPKLIGDLFGIDSSNMKLGIMDKLAAGGMLAAGAAAGGAITSAVRGFTGSKKHGIRRVGSALGSGISGARRGLKSGMGAKNFTEMKQAASKAASDVETKNQKREAYFASHGGTVRGVAAGLVKDTSDSIKSWAGIDNLAGLKEQKAIYDQGMGFYKRLKALAADEAELQAYSGQYKALQEKIIDREDFYKEEEIVDFNTGQKTTKRVFDEKAYVNALAEHRKQVEAAEKRLKVATLQTIVNNRGKGNYAAIMDEFTTFKSLHADDDTIRNMGTITPDDLAKFETITYKGYTGKEILANLGDNDICEFWDDLKAGKVQNTDGSIFSIASNDNTFKIKSGEMARAIAQKEAESQKSDNK